ncbi:MAG: hypothetical protein KF726_14545 [Anaerolineae bacterium]|nr:hypothetical protein [Anaerolineae bacterium]
MYSDAKVTEDMSNSAKVIPFPRAVALGEHLGIDVPTRYNEATHEVINGAMFVDSLITPVLLNMSRPTVWTCRFLSALLFLTRRSSDSLTLKQALQVEAATGLLVMFAAINGSISKRFWENCYLFIGGVIMIANALMTELND